MLYTLSKPFIVNVTDYESAYLYRDYTVSMYKSAMSIRTELIFKGKTFFDGDGNTQIDITEVLRDHSWHNTLKLDSSQNYIPANLKSLQSTILTTVESEKMIYNSKVVVSIPDINYQEDFFVSSYHIPSYVDKAPLTFEAWNPTMAAGALMMNTYTFAALPEIPLMSTKNYWLGLEYATRVGWNGRVYLMGDLSGSRVELARGENGSFSACFTLFDIFDALRCTEGYVRMTADEIYGRFNSIAKVDACPARFYVAWWDINGYHSMGMDGYADMGSNGERDTVTGFYGEKRVNWNTDTTTYTLRSNYLDRDHYDTLLTIGQAYMIYVFDTENDKGAWCTLDDTSLATLPRGGNRPMYATLRFKEIYSVKQ